MKKLLAVMARFCTVSFAFELVYVLALIIAEAMGSEGAFVPDFIPSALTSTLLLAVTAGSFSSFFTINRLYSSRFAAYLTAFILPFITLAGTALVVRLMPQIQLRSSATDPGFFAGHKTLIGWFAEISGGSWGLVALGCASFAGFLAAFWCLTRLFGKRPLIGAFIMPACFIFAIYAYSVFLSGTIEAAFSFLGLHLSRPLSSAIIVTLFSCAMVLLDLIVASPPAGSRQNG